MRISSRTPEGEPNTCGVCGKAFVLEPSDPAGDAPCPHCGSLTWFAQSLTRARQPESWTRDFPFAGERPLLMPLFRSVAPALDLPDHEDIEITEADRESFEFGRQYRDFNRRSYLQSRGTARTVRISLLCRLSKCESRVDVESELGPPRYAIGADEYYRSGGSIVVLQFHGSRVAAIYSQAAFSPRALGAGADQDDSWLVLKPEQIWRKSPTLVTAHIMRV